MRNVRFNQAGLSFSIALTFWTLFCECFSWKPPSCMEKKQHWITGATDLWYQSTAHMLQVCHPGQSCTKGDKAASVQFCCVGVFLSLSTDRPRQGKGPTLAFYRERVNLMSVFLFAARGKIPFFFPWLDVDSRAEGNTSSFSLRPCSLSPAGVAEVSCVACAQVDFPDAARSAQLCVLTLLCVGG